MHVLIPVSPGELVDKITILEIKQERMVERDKIVHVEHELALLNQVWSESGCGSPIVDAARVELKAINEQLWEIEDEIRAKEAAHTFDAGFIELARAVYITNDQRSVLKLRINLDTGSDLIEEKSYREYG